MHIADGYLSPATVAVSYAVAVPLWVYGFKKLKEKLNEETLPMIGALAALSFVIMMFNVPVPGGTSGHAVGAALIAILFGPWVGFISVSLVLLIQAIVFGDGGISAWAVNSLAMGFIGSFVGYYVFKLLKDKTKFAPFFAGYISIVTAALFVGIILGIQPIFWTHNGHPLYFPFSLKISVPAMVGEHALFFGIVEGIFTQLVYNFLTKKENEKVAA
ncbi:cobalt transporter CbiM [Caminibacter pacificus]|uniref:Cobalt transporter CbiM n=1 Tax=Caminibacter pacificus TaxID=1424653 RepID=A0AAJ4RDH9_9BACT|nr:cobalt transporter CbiM [Caminibacter pacificus]QCI28635.1 cobalt transporter CbiM [Caminibacter pacificus]ROR40636.1 cobalt/nickel transport system permease protein [Caminibacter pacificus]